MALQLDVSGLWVNVSGSPEEEESLERILTVVENKNKSNESTHCFFDTERQRFLYGLLPLVEEEYLTLGIDLEISGLPSKGVVPEVDPWILNLFELRQYQKDSVELMFEHKNGIIKIPTAGGKGAVGGAFLKILDQPGFFFVNSAPLTNQIYQKFNDYGLRDVGMIGDGRFEPGFVTVADIRWFSQLLKKRSSKLKDIINQAKVIIMDEVQHLPSDSWLRVALCFPGIQYRFGLSGTPWSKRDRQSYRDYLTMGIFGETLLDLPASYLIENGYIANPQIYFLEVNQPKVDVHYNKQGWKGSQGKTYQKIYQKGIVEHPTRNNMAVTLATMLVKAYNKNTLILVKQIEHGKTILKKLHNTTVPAVFLAGNSMVYKIDEHGDVVQETDQIVDYKSETVSDYTNGKYRVLIASPVLGEGFDLPDSAVEALILLTGEKSLIPVLQRLGRALRPKPGDNKVLVFDFQDNHHFFFKNHSASRIKEYEAEGYSVFTADKFVEDFL